MREHVSQEKKTTTGYSIPSLKHPIRGFGLESSAISPQAVPELQPLHKLVTHDISRIPLRSQAKLSISQPGDIYEQEADSVAQQVMQRMAQPVNRQSIQPEASPEEEEELQMKSLDNSTKIMQNDITTTEVSARRQIDQENPVKMPLTSLSIQTMKIRGTDQPSQVSTTTHNKHVVNITDQAAKAESGFGSTTFVTSDAILTSAVDTNTHDFAELANQKSARVDFQANVPIYLWDKTGTKPIPERFGKGEPVSKTIDGQDTNCEIGVVKGGDDIIKVTHFKKV